MFSEYREVDIWVGSFPTETALDAYLEETLSTDDTVPVSRFAADQHQSFYDHDFIEAGFVPTTDDVSALIGPSSFADSYCDDAVSACKELGITSANSVILAFGQSIRTPMSVDGDSYNLRYIGRFDCDPTVSESTAGDAGPPAAVQLMLLGDEPIQFDGTQVSSVPVDARGLVIGKGDNDTKTPRLDLSMYVAGIASDQVKVYQDQFDQWIIEDLGNNGLTLLNDEPLIGRTFPWHGKRLTIGPVNLVWSTRPQDTAS